MVLRVFCSFVVLSVLAGTATAQSEKSSPTPSALMRFVGPDVGLCVEISDLKRVAPRFLRSPLFERIERLPIYRAWKLSGEYRNLAKIKRAIESQTGKPLGEFALGLLGESVVLAVYPQESGEPAGVLLLQAEDSESLQNALAAWNRDSRVTVQTVKLSTGEYQKRLEPRQKKPNFYFVQGAVFALTDNESIIKDVAARSGSDPAQSMWDSEAYRQALQTLSADCWTRVYFNPSVWNVAWPAEDKRDTIEQFLVDSWDRSQFVVGGLQSGNGLSAEVILQFDAANLPARWNEWVERTNGFPEFLKRVPTEAVFVLAGRQDLIGLDRLILAELSDTEKQQWQIARNVGRGFLLGMDLFDDVLPALRPNWGMYLVPRQPLDPSAVPVEGVFALELSPPKESEDGSKTTVRDALGNALNIGFNWLAIEQNSKSPKAAAFVKTKSLETSQADSVTMHWVESLGPYQPAFCVAPNALVFASSPDVLAEFVASPSDKFPATRLSGLWQKHFGEAPRGQVVLLHWEKIREFLAKHEQILVTQAADWHHLPETEARKRLDRLANVLTLLDGVFLGVEVRENQVRVTTGGVIAD